MLINTVRYNYSDHDLPLGNEMSESDFINVPILEDPSQEDQRHSYIDPENTTTLEDFTQEGQNEGLFDEKGSG